MDSCLTDIELGMKYWIVFTLLYKATLQCEATVVVIRGYIYKTELNSWKPLDQL